MSYSPSGKPIRLAVFFDQSIAAGGGYQQALNAVALVRALPESLCVSVFVVPDSNSVATLRSIGIEAVCLSLSHAARIILRLRSRIRSQRLLRFLSRILGDNPLDRFFRRHRIDLVYFTSPSDYAAFTEAQNYIFTVWDMCHRDHVEFPEVRHMREFERRERSYHASIPKAVATLVDSSLARVNLVRRYGVDEERVFVMSFSPSQTVMNNDSPNVINVRNRYDLHCDYVFYPAQFWAHKNHSYLLKGLKLLEDNYGVQVAAIFAGGDAGGNRAYVETLAEQLGVAARVRFAGFVSDREIPDFYRQSLALVMPTYFGPTNMPPLEAFHLGVPVLYSNLPGLREQVGEAALLMDLSKPESVADHLHVLMTQPEVRKRLVEAGYRQLAQQSDASRIAVLTFIVDSFRNKRECWARNS